jgi:nucleotide-binding universal stress UspA family protein
MPGIVVGVDGSPNSEHALEWAMQEAATRHAPLTVVAVHAVPKSHWGHLPVVGQSDTPALEELRRGVEEMTQQAASRFGDASLPSPNIRAVSGFPVEELLATSQDADLLVVGSRGAGGFARLMAGSVSSQVVQHATCPVVVIPHHD